MKTEVNIGGGGGWKTVSTLALIVILLAASTAYFMYNSKQYKTAYKNEQECSYELSRSMNALQDSCKTYQVKLAKNKRLWVSETEALSLKSENISNLYADKVIEISKLHVQVKDLKTMANAVTITHDSIDVPVYIDSVYSLHTSYNDGYLNMHNTILRNGTANIRYEYKDSFTLINAYKRKRFLFFRYGRKHDTYYLYSKNPKTRVVGLNVIRRIE